MQPRVERAKFERTNQRLFRFDSSRLTATRDKQPRFIFFLFFFIKSNLKQLRLITKRTPEGGHQSERVYFHPLPRALYVCVFTTQQK